MRRPHEIGGDIGFEVVDGVVDGFGQAVDGLLDLLRKESPEAEQEGTTAQHRWPNGDGAG